MLCSYNGIVFQIVRVTDFVREAVYTPDLTTYLYDHISIRLECLLNVGATNGEDNTTVGLRRVANKLLQNPNGVPPADPINVNPASSPTPIPRVGASTKQWSPVTTYNELASRLRQPRQKLLIWMDSKLTGDGDPGEIIIESPLPGYSQDAKNGPLCIVHRLDGFHGNSTLWMDVEFKTDIDICTKGDISTNPNGVMLANRWGMIVEHDPDNHTAIHIINGQAIFRGDLLAKIGVIPDLFRGLFIHPIPAGFRRDPPTLNFNPDNCVVEYQIVDREQQMNFVGGQAFHATKIEVMETRRYEHPFQIGTGWGSGPTSKIINQVWEKVKQFGDPFGFRKML